MKNVLPNDLLGEMQIDREEIFTFTVSNEIVV